MTTIFPHPTEGRRIVEMGRRRFNAAEVGDGGVDTIRYAYEAAKIHAGYQTFAIPERDGGVTILHGLPA